MRRIFLSLVVLGGVVVCPAFVSAVTFTSNTLIEAPMGSTCLKINNGI